MSVDGQIMAIETLLISMMVGVYSLAEKARSNARQMRKHKKIPQP